MSFKFIKYIFVCTTEEKELLEDFASFLMSKLLVLRETITRERKNKGYPALIQYFFLDEFFSLFEILHENISSFITISTIEYFGFDDYADLSLKHAYN